jgi:hypothetical protein
MPLVPGNSTRAPLQAPVPAVSAAAGGTHNRVPSVRVNFAPLPKDLAGRVAAIDVAASNYRAALKNVTWVANELLLRVAPLSTSSKNFRRNLAAVAAYGSFMSQVLRVLLPLDVDKVRDVLLELADLEPAQ